MKNKNIYLVYKNKMNKKMKYYIGQTANTLLKKDQFMVSSKLGLNKHYLYLLVKKDLNLGIIFGDQPN